jgi:hypothetical protein
MEGDLITSEEEALAEEEIKMLLLSLFIERLRRERPATSS